MHTADTLLNRLLAGTRLRHLQVLVTVAELGSLKKAGQDVGMTQPAVTRVVSDLEKLLGVRLFQRHAHGVSPTALCAALLPAAQRAIDALSVGAETIVAHMGGADRVVRIGATAGAIGGFLAEALPRMHARHADIAVRLVQDEDRSLMQHAQRGEFDMIGLREPHTVAQGWMFLPMQEDRLVVVAGIHHPLARRRSLRFRSLARETWVGAPVSTLGRRVLDQLLASQAITPRYAQITTIATYATWALLAQQRLLTLIPHSVVRPLVDAGQLAVLPIDEPLPALRPLGLLVRPDYQSTAAGVLVALLGERHKA